MWPLDFPHWQRSLVDRLERSIGRQLIATDLDCLAWNRTAQTLTVAAVPLLGELRSCNSISNVFRHYTPRP